VALGPAAVIDAKVDALLAAMDDKIPARTANLALRQLDTLVLAPVRARLINVSHLILAPDGKLNLVPFDVLVDPQGHYALEEYLVSYVSTGRDLLRFAATEKSRSAAVIVAGPDYGPLASAGAVSFPPIADALGEAADLQRYFPTAVISGKEATKSVLKALAGPAMLHVATHGFYARDRRPRPMPAPGHPSRDMFADGTTSMLPPPRPDDPADGLDRAGLALAGANQGPDGIVTARELAGFDLWGTQLVVLSACETGVGTVSSGDGVFGLRRALILAGAASQLTSLWSVSDKSTRELMRTYYAELASGTGRAEALRQAKLQLMRQPHRAHPYYWAAFIATGDWRPLEENTILEQRRAP
jgi:CHAT domain-containing protein